MSVFLEGNLRFDFSGAVRSLRFDDPPSHQLSHCMKAVDFLVETRDRVLLVEVKDPDHPRARGHHVAEFLSELKSGSLVANSLVPKCRDTFLYQWSWQDRAVTMNKPWVYLVLIAFAQLQPPELTALNDNLKRSLPISTPYGQRWRPLVRDCHVFNLAGWNANLGQQFPVQRLP